MRTVPIADVVHDVVATLRGRIQDEEKPMSIDASVPADLPHVWADRERLTQVLTNLADNAFNYSHSGGHILLAVEHDALHGEVVVRVTDSGIGIAPDDQARLFDRFYRGEDALVLASSGTGLGLAIARQLAEMHGGRLWLDSSVVGQGSTFALAIPVAQAEQATPVDASGVAG
jgi:signal transduction histidine kinase